MKVATRFETAFRDRVLLAAKRAFGATITLTQSGVASAPFTARRSDYDYEVFGDELGVATKSTERHYRFAAADVLISGSPVTPVAGDTITDNGETFAIAHGAGPAVEKQLSGIEWFVRAKKVA